MSSEEKIFKIAFMATLGALAFYLVALVFSLAVFGGLGKGFAAVFSGEVLHAVKLSVATATAASAAALLVAVPTAYALSRYRFFGRGVVDTILDIPIFISPVAIGAMLLIFFNTDAGKAIERIHPFVFNAYGIVLAQFTIVSALAVRLLKSTFDSIDERYENVGRTLGLTKTQSFLRVTLPMSRNGLLAAAIITWARAIGEFGATVTIAGATPFKTETLPVAIHMSFATADLQKAVAVIMLLVVIAAGSLLALRGIMKGELPS